MLTKKQKLTKNRSIPCDLKVFYKGLSFTLEVDLSDNAADNDKKAIETAKMIINQKLK